MQQADRKKTDCFRVVGFCSHCNTVFEAIGCCYHFCHCQDVRPSLAEEQNQRSRKKRKFIELTRSYKREKVLTVTGT